VALSSPIAVNVCILVLGRQPGTHPRWQRGIAINWRPDKVACVRKINLVD
jgi:hypothetical protein